MIRGHWEVDRYIPEPSVATFERFLGRIIAARPCDGCDKPLARTAIVHISKQLFHKECAPA